MIVAPDPLHPPLRENPGFHFQTTDRGRSGAVENNDVTPDGIPSPETILGQAPLRARELVLVVDDDACMRESICMQLEGLFDVVVARNGVEGCEAAVNKLPDLILSDVRMPLKSGLDLCRELRATKLTSEIPIIMLTGTLDQEVKLECLSAGATEFIAKPCASAELKLRVRNLIKIHRQQRDLASQKVQLERALAELREKEELLVRQESLASLGRMSATLIHEINNPLNYALQGIHLLQKKTPQLPPDSSADFAEVLQDIHNGVARVSRVIAELREFTNPANKGRLQSAQLRHAVLSAIETVTKASKAQCEIVVEVPAELTVSVHENLLVQVLTNLIKNALEATASKIYPHGSQARLLLRAMLQNGSTRLTIRDNGIGMTPEVCEHVFDAFFTTKDVGAGMGLGLSICHTFLTEFGATIDVQSSPEEFTEFTLVFPLPR